MRRVLIAVVAILLLVPCAAGAQSVLRIGLNDEPDALDPTISRAYTGRLVFAALCDKLFDVTQEVSNNCFKVARYFVRSSLGKVISNQRPPAGLEIRSSIGQKLERIPCGRPGGGHV